VVLCGVIWCYVCYVVLCDVIRYCRPHVPARKIAVITSTQAREARDAKSKRQEARGKRQEARGKRQERQARQERQERQDWQAR
jgi:hypothetical protein